MYKTLQSTDVRKNVHVDASGLSDASRALFERAVQDPTSLTDAERRLIL